ncbi:MAG: penicillin-binding transpeptidase domain-containing protein [Candidatus Omnitrophica bacterium]|nr:penicillin-binding transpeptidase domain-containing protein [Candidatus Omnitrophota bacterium]
MYFKRHSLRFVFLFLFFFCLLIFFFIKLIFIQVFKSEYLSGLADRQHSHILRLEPKRGTIYDRKFRPLALNVAAYSLYASPRSMSIEQKAKAIKAIHETLGLEESFLKDRMSRDKSFVWISRKLSPDQADKIKALDFKGLNFIKESRRYYPGQTLAAHVIGFAGIDNYGLEGLELEYNDSLSGQFGMAQILRDAKQQELLIQESFLLPKHGFDLVLTIDETIQYFAEQALEKAFEKHHAKSASIIVMDPKTGEILALANRPTYNLSDLESSSVDNRRNRAISDMYEPGSVFKIVTACAAIEEEAFSEDDKIFCENGEYKVANHVLHDHHPQGMLTFKGVIEQSSNIGTVKVAQKIGGEAVNHYARLFQFGKATGVNLPGEVSGVLKPVSRWSGTSIGAVPIGHEIGVTALQLVCAVSAIANNGIYMKPFIVQYIRDQNGDVVEGFFPQPITEVTSPETAMRVKDILVGVVDNGTGKRAQIKGVKVAGKTGTAQKIVDGLYSHSKFYATFIGFAPADDPKIAMVVFFDEPHPDHYGGTVSAPVFKEVAENVLKYLKANEEN